MLKEKITRKEIAQELSQLCKTFSKHLYEDFGIKAQSILGIKLDEFQSVTLAREIYMINLWIISKVLSPDNKVLDELHKIYLFSYENMAHTEHGKREFPKEAEKELHERYRRYYHDWDNDSGGNQTVLAITMLEYMLNKGQPDKRFANTLLTSEINAHILLMMKSILDTRLEIKNKFEIVD